MLAQGLAIGFASQAVLSAVLVAVLRAVSGGDVVVVLVTACWFWCCSSWITCFGLNPHMLSGVYAGIICR